MKRLTIIAVTMGMLFITSCSSLKVVKQNDVKLNNDLIVVDANTNLPFSGVVITYYPNGKIKSRTEYSNGKQNGKSISWYENGQKSREFNRKDDKRIGRCYCWNKDGSVWAELQFNPNNGYQILYFPKTKCVLTWNKITKTNNCKIIDLKGNLISEYNRIDGKKDGTEYNDDYNKPFIKHYYKGKLIANTDLEGNKIDISKFKQNTKKNLGTKMHELEDKLEAIKEKNKSHNEVSVDQHSALQKNNGRE